MEEQLPLVTCVMVTGGDAKRAWWAKRSYLAFVQQTEWPNRELLVINESGGTDWEFRVSPDDGGALDGMPVREILVPHRQYTVGEMRNMGKTEADGDWILQWDDDDWSHPERVYDQMRFRKEGHCQVLRAQVRFSIITGTAYVYHNPEGIAGTILHPRTDFMYPKQTNFEDSLFLLGGWKGRHTVLDNYVRPHLYLRFHHSQNLNNAKHVMRKYAEQKWKGRWVDLPEQWGWMPRKAVEYLKFVLSTHYSIEVPPRVWVDVLKMRKRGHPTDDDTVKGLTECGVT